MVEKYFQNGKTSKTSTYKAAQVVPNTTYINEK